MAECMSYRCAAARIEEKVGGVGSNGRLIGNWPVTQSHANNGSHVRFCAKDMNRDSGGFSCEGISIKRQSAGVGRKFLYKKI